PRSDRMDLHPIQAEPSDEDRAAVDALLGPAERDPPKGLRDAKERRHLLLPALHAIQGRSGWVSPGALGYVCQRLEVPPAEGYGVPSFSALFALEKRPPVVAHVCDDIACKVRGADALCAELEERLGPPGGHHGAGSGSNPVNSAGATTWMRSPCLGL